ncbi:polyprenol monophosphomannose synthase [bacterium]|nr:polyprenol monophosphomannose synthase [bacterium]
MSVTQANPTGASVLIIIPTYNEVDNVRRLLPIVLEKDARISILIVDDGSPDGTADAVRALQQIHPGRIELMERDGKLGLGTAYVAGFRWALEREYEYIFEMDADFSHDPGAVPAFLREAERYDLVIGSRYISGVNVINWPMSRLLLSWSANLYTRIVTGMPIQDATSGFKCFKRRVLESIDLDKISSDGYCFQIEMNFKVYKQGFSIKEIPIIFMDREVGSSKMTSGIIHEAAWKVWKLRILSLLGKL